MTENSAGHMVRCHLCAIRKVELNQFKLTTKQDIEDFLTGLAFYGTAAAETRPWAAFSTNASSRAMTSRSCAPMRSTTTRIAAAPSSWAASRRAPRKCLGDGARRLYQAQARFAEMSICAVRALEQYIGKSGLCHRGHKYRLLHGGGLHDGPARDRRRPVGRAVPEMIQARARCRGPERSARGLLRFRATATSRSRRPAIRRWSASASSAVLYGEMAEAVRHDGARGEGDLDPPRALRRPRHQPRRGRRARSARRRRQSVRRVMGREALRELATKDADGYYWGSYIVEGEGEYAGNAYKVVQEREPHP